MQHFLLICMIKDVCFGFQLFGGDGGGIETVGGGSTDGGTNYDSSFSDDHSGDNYYCDEGLK